MPKSYVPKNRKLIIILTTIGFFALLLGFFLPYFAKVDPELINKGDPLIAKIYHHIEDGQSKDKVLAALSNEEKQLVEDYEIEWFESVLKIKTDKGILKAQYLPIEHVVVYGANLEIQYGEVKDRIISYFTPWGLKRCHSEEEMQKLIKTTLFGTNGIILGNISRIEQINDIKNYDEAMLYMYIILKNLIKSDPIFLEYVMNLAEPEKGYHWRYQINEWINKLLKNSILTPQIPDLNPNYPKEFYEGLKQWYEMNKENVKFSKKCLLQ